MINFNGTIIPSADILLYDSRAVRYGDGVFETLKVINNKILFFEDHYFRLLSGMRILRMEIPSFFTMKFLEEQIISTVVANKYSNSARARIIVYRNQGGFYLPDTNSVSFLIDVSYTNPLYLFKKVYEVDIFKDYYISKQILSTIKSTNKLINILGSIYAEENALDNCFLINENKNVIEALQGNIFMLSGNKLITPPISEGCLNGVMRKNILKMVKEIDNIDILEEPISPFNLQKADELFITNVIIGIQPITKYRKKLYNTTFASNLLIGLNKITTSI